MAGAHVIGPEAQLWGGAMVSKAGAAMQVVTSLQNGVWERQEKCMQALLVWLETQMFEWPYDRCDFHSPNCGLSPSQLSSATAAAMQS